MQNLKITDALLNLGEGAPLNNDGTLAECVRACVSNTESVSLRNLICKLG